MFARKRRLVEKEPGRTSPFQIRRKQTEASEPYHLSQLRIVLLGERGAGKSSAGNAILGRHAFGVGGGTERSQRGRGEVEGREVSVVDTPGWGGAGGGADAVRAEIRLSVSLCPWGPHAFLLAVPAGWGLFPESQRLAAWNHLELLGPGAWRHTILLFTKADRLGDASAQQQVDRRGPDLQRLAEACGGRCHALSGRATPARHRQVTALLEKIERMVVANDGWHYKPQTLPPAEREGRGEGEAKRRASDWEEEALRHRLEEKEREVEEVRRRYDEKTQEQEVEWRKREDELKLNLEEQLRSREQALKLNFEEQLRSREEELKLNFEEMQRTREEELKLTFEEQLRSREQALKLNFEQVQRSREEVLRFNFEEVQRSRDEELKLTFEEQLRTREEALKLNFEEQLRSREEVLRLNFEEVERSREELKLTLEEQLRSREEVLKLNFEEMQRTREQALKLNFEQVQRSREEELKLTFEEQLRTREDALKMSFEEELRTREEELKLTFAERLRSREQELKVNFGKCGRREEELIEGWRKAEEDERMMMKETEERERGVLPVKSKGESSSSKSTGLRPASERLPGGGTVDSVRQELLLTLMGEAQTRSCAAGNTVPQETETWSGSADWFHGDGLVQSEEGWDVGCRDNLPSRGRPPVRVAAVEQNLREGRSRRLAAVQQGSEGSGPECPGLEGFIPTERAGCQQTARMHSNSTLSNRGQVLTDRGQVLSGREQVLRDRGQALSDKDQALSNGNEGDGNCGTAQELPGEEVQGEVQEEVQDWGSGNRRGGELGGPDSGGGGCQGHRTSATQGQTESCTEMRGREEEEERKEEQTQIQPERGSSGGELQEEKKHFAMKAYIRPVAMVLGAVIGGAAGALRGAAGGAGAGAVIGAAVGAQLTAVLGGGTSNRHVQAPTDNHNIGQNLVHSQSGTIRNIRLQH